MSKRDKQKRALLNRRVFILSVMHFLTIGVLGGRLYQLQILHNSKYRTLSDSNRIKIIFTPPLRGQILDINGDIIATNENYYNIICSPANISDINALIDTLSQVLNLNSSEKTNLKIKISKGKPFVVHKKSDWDTLSSIEFNKYNLNGVYISMEHRRNYPFKESLSHVIGYLMLTTHQKISLTYHIGKSGLEALHEDILQGSPGVIQQEVDSKGNVIRELSNTESVTGHNIRTTVDAKLQAHIYTLLNKEGSATAVIDLSNGHIVALCNSPSYDNNLFIDGISNEEWDELNNNPYLPMTNRALTMQTAPGSTFKLITALAALETGIIGTEKTIKCTGSVKMSNHVFHCWKKNGHGMMNLQNAISHSCNSYFYELAKIINIDALSNIALEFGLGKTFNINPREELSGIIPTKQWRQNKLTSKWQIGNTLNMVIGHGYILTTPIQLAIMASRIATGRALIPSIIYDKNKVFDQLDIKSAHLKTVQKGMFDVLNSPYGTAKNFASKVQNIAGKTGTAQVVGRHNKHIKKRETSDHALFIGYAPYENPQYALSVVLEHGGGGGNAARVACKIFDYLKDFYSY